MEHLLPGALLFLAWCQHESVMMEWEAGRYIRRISAGEKNYVGPTAHRGLYLVSFMALMNHDYKLGNGNNSTNISIENNRGRVHIQTICLLHTQCMQYIYKTFSSYVYPSNPPGKFPPIHLHTFFWHQANVLFIIFFLPSELKTPRCFLNFGPKRCNGLSKHRTFISSSCTLSAMNVNKKAINFAKKKFVMKKYIWYEKT